MLYFYSILYLRYTYSLCMHACMHRYVICIIVLLVWIFSVTIVSVSVCMMQECRSSWNMPPPCQFFFLKHKLSPDVKNSYLDFNKYIFLDFIFAKMSLLFKLDQICTGGCTVCCMCERGHLGPWGAGLSGAIHQPHLLFPSGANKRCPHPKTKSLWHPLFPLGTHPRMLQSHHQGTRPIICQC